MKNLTYRMIVANSNKPEHIRKKMVEQYYELGENASKTAREWRTKRQTVSFWVTRYELYGDAGLLDMSRAPHRIPHKTPKGVEESILALADRTMRPGQDRIQVDLKDDYGITRSTSTINRVLHAHGRIQKRKRKYQKKKQVSEYKRRLKALRDWQIDVKDLIDIPNIYALVAERIIPRYQFTARDCITGVMFICYAWEHTLINAIRFAGTLLEHLRAYGIHGSEITVQTDNGSEFIGCITKKEPSGFTELIEDTYFGRHNTIPPGRKEWQGYVESVHGRIEVEFYDVESFRSLRQFLSKSYTYVLNWNLKRKNLEKKKCPYRLIKEKCRILDPSICDFQPFILDEMRTFVQNYQYQGVPYVADEVTFSL